MIDLKRLLLPGGIRAQRFIYLINPFINQNNENMKKLITFLLTLFVISGMTLAQERETDDVRESIEKSWRTESRTYSDKDLSTRGTVFLDEDFSGNALPADWTAAEFGDPGYGWEFGSGLAFIDSDEAGSGNYVAGTLTTPALDLSGATNVTLALNHYFVRGSGSWINDGKILISADGSPYVTAFDFTENQGSTTYSLVEYDITAWAAGESDVYIRFFYDDLNNWAYWWDIDNVVVYEPPLILSVQILPVQLMRLKMFP